MKNIPFIYFTSLLFALPILPTTVMVYGCFDSSIHPGHISFLQQAKKFGDKLIVIITPDSIINQLKKRMPFEPQSIRMHMVAQIQEVDEVYLGDSELGEYTMLKKIKPDIICLGYDQHGLGKDLAWRMQEGLLPTIPLIYLEPFEPEKYHTSIIRKDSVFI